MNFTPSNFYISIKDLFAILLPGAIGVLLLSVHNEEADWVKLIVPAPEADISFIQSFLFLMAAYMCGHIIGQLSSFWDNWVYAPWKGRVFVESVACEEVKRIRKEKYAIPVDEKLVIISHYKWSLYKLQKEQPRAILEIERYMADSKFFRSLHVLIFMVMFFAAYDKDQWSLLYWGSVASLGLFMLAGIVMSVKDSLKKRIKSVSLLFFALSYLGISISLICNEWQWLALSLLGAFSLLVYFKKRRKSTETAYRYICFLEKQNNKAKKDDEKVIRGGEVKLLIE